MLPAQLLDHHGSLEADLVAGLVPECDAPAAQLVEPLEGLDQVAVEGEAAHLAVGDDVDTDLLLEGERAVDSLVFDALEGDRVQLAGLVLGTRPLQGLRPQEAADDLGTELLGPPHRPSA